MARFGDHCSTIGTILLFLFNLKDQSKSTFYNAKKLPLDKAALTLPIKGRVKQVCRMDKGPTGFYFYASNLKILVHQGRI
jgi:hypothetical protein